MLLLPLLGCQSASDAPARHEGPTVAATSPALADTSFDARPFFENAVLVTDKGEYVHIFWDAQTAAKELEGADRRRRLTAAAAQLVLDRFPAGTATDIAKVDIVFVKAKDEYGKPKWDSLQKIAHFELHPTRIKKEARVTEGRVAGVPEQAFDRIEVF